MFARSHSLYCRFHLYQEDGETNVQVLDLVQLLAPLELQDEAHLVLKTFEGFKSVSHLVTPSYDTTILSIVKGAGFPVNWNHLVLSFVENSIELTS